jgi:hypothetical protein
MQLSNGVTMAESTPHNTDYVECPAFPGNGILGKIEGYPIFFCSLGLTAWATNMGLGRMGEISDISFHTLVSASDNFIRPKTLREANDRIRNAIAKLPHPRSSRQSIHIGHAVGSGFVQSIFSSPSRRLPFECFPSFSRRDADLKILGNIPLAEYRLDVVSRQSLPTERSRTVTLDLGKQRAHNS